MKVAYFDCFSGISGDMVLGALVDAGLPGDALIEAVGRLNLPGIEVRFRKARQGCLAGTRAEVVVQEGPKDRHLPEILRILDASALSERVKSQAGAVFRRLAEAEAAVHGIPPEKVHFHETGALDAIADIVGATAGLEALGVEEVYASPLALGEGYVTCRHGVLPVPAPATARLVQGFEVRFTGIVHELTTPTGAAIITTLARPGERPSAFIGEAVGYGFGSREGEKLPNALRLLLGRVPQDASEEVVLLETNVDQVTGEGAGHLIGRCLEEGALDAFAVPAQMKKSRPGLILRVLCREDRAARLRDLIWVETGTLGIRMERILRFVLPREILQVETSLGAVRVKKARLPDGTYLLNPEYDDAARIARERGLPLRRVMERIRAEIDPDHPAGD